MKPVFNLTPQNFPAFSFSRLLLAPPLPLVHQVDS